MDSPIEKKRRRSRRKSVHKVDAEEPLPPPESSLSETQDSSLQHAFEHEDYTPEEDYAAESIEYTGPFPRDPSPNSARCGLLATIIQSGLRPLEYLVWPEAEHLPDGVEGDLNDKSFEFLFPDLARVQRDLGTILLRALLWGDKTFPEKYHQALKDLKRMFAGRSTNKTLVGKIIPFSSEIRSTCQTKAQARSYVEAKVGRKLYDEEWNRLQRVMRWNWLPDGGKRGRPRKLITKRQRKVS